MESSASRRAAGVRRGCADDPAKPHRVAVGLRWLLPGSSPIHAPGQRGGVGAAMQVGDDVAGRERVHARRAQRGRGALVTYVYARRAAEDDALERAVGRHVRALRRAYEDGRQTRKQGHAERVRITDGERQIVTVALRAQKRYLGSKESRKPGEHVAAECANVTHRHESAARHRATRPDFAECAVSRSHADERKVRHRSVWIECANFARDALGDRGLAVSVRNEEQPRHQAAALRSGTRS